LRRYDLDTVMFPVNPRLWADTAYRADAEALLGLAASRDVGVMAIKAAAFRPWNDGLGWGSEERPADTWYEPLTDPDTIARHVRFTLSVEGVHAFCTPGDVNVARLAIDAAGAYAPLDDAERADVMAAVAGEPHIFPLPR
jgi:hypothetical protein